MVVLFAGTFLPSTAQEGSWLGARPGDNTRYLIDLAVDPLPRTLESFGLQYLASDSEDTMLIEINAGPVMGLFLPRIINVDVETGAVLNDNVPHKSWIYWLPANKQVSDKVLLDFGEVYNLFEVELTVKEFGVRSFQNQDVDVYFAEGISDGKTVSYVVEKNSGVVLDVLLKDGDRVLFHGKLVETNVEMMEATKAHVEEPLVEEPLVEEPQVPSSIEEEKQSEINISVAMKEKKRITLVAVKNPDDVPVYAVKVKSTDANIKFIKARHWDRERVDQNTVIVQTADRPLAKGTLILLLIIDKKGSGLEWSAIDDMGVQITAGSVLPR